MSDLMPGPSFAEDPPDARPGPEAVPEPAWSAWSRRFAAARRRAAMRRMAVQFLTPPRHVSAPMLDRPDGGERVAVAGWPGRLNLWRWGRGPATLLVHGWGRDHQELMPIARTLVDAGCSAAALDLPAHGRSSGRTSHVVEAAQAIRAAAACLDGLLGIVAVGEGATAAVLALAAGLSPPSIVLLAPLVDPLAPLWRTAAVRGLQADAVAELTALVEGRLDCPAASLDLRAIAPRMSVPALVVHAAQDPRCPIDDAFALVAHWPGAELHLVADPADAGPGSVATRARVVNFLLRDPQAAPWAVSRNA